MKTISQEIGIYLSTPQTRECALLCLLNSSLSYFLNMYHKALSASALINCTFGTLSLLWHIGSK